MYLPTLRAIPAAVLAQAMLTALGVSWPLAAAGGLIIGALSAGASKAPTLVAAAAAGFFSTSGACALTTGLASAAWATATSDDPRASAQACAAGSALSVLLTWALPPAWIPVAAVALAQLWPIWAAADPQVPLCPRGLPAPLRLRLAAALNDATQAWAKADDQPGRRLLAEAGAELVALSWADVRLSSVRRTTPELTGELTRVRERWLRTANLLARARRAHEVARALPAAIPDNSYADLARACDGLERHVHAVCTSRSELDPVQGATTASKVTPSPSRARNTRGEV